MEDSTDKPRYSAEVRKPINRPKYKVQSLTWRRLFIAAAIVSGLLAYLLCMALKGNAVLQSAAYGNKATKTMTGINNPAYKNGSSFLKPGWRGNDWETVRLEVYKRDKFTCKDCGTKCISKRDYKQNTSRIIQCHHIKNYDGKNNTKDNLITLCLSCHLKRHNKV